MKIVYCIVFALLLCNNGIKAQESLEAIHTISEAAVAYMESEGYEVVRAEFDVITNSNSERLLQRHLSPDHTYQILAFGDESIKDLDLYLYRHNGEDYELVEKDVSDGNAAAIEYRPSKWEEFFFIVKAEEFGFDEVAGFYSIIVAHDLEGGEEEEEEEDTKGIAIKTTTRSFARMKENGDLDIQKTIDYVSTISINAAVSKLTIKTPRGGLDTYLISSQEEKDGLWTFDAIGEDDKEHAIIIELENKLLMIAGEDRKGVWLYIYDMNEILED